MKVVNGIALLLGVVVATGSLAAPSTSQRLELLERRVNLITDLTLQLDEVRRENRQLRGEIENLGYQIEQLKRKQRDLYLDIDQRLGAAQAGSQGGMSGAPSAAPAASDGGSARSLQPTSAAPASKQAKIDAEYQAAYALLSPQQKRYKEAAKAFATFLERYPQNSLAPNAQYWLGEAHYVSQQNAKALAAFEQVVVRYPDSPKVPGALFKIGRLQQAAGKTSAARATFERVVREHPNSSSATLARQRLDRLGR